MTALGTAPTPDVGQGSRVLAVVDDYAEAEGIVRKLAARDFPVEHTRIVGDDLRVVEQVTGRLTLWGAAGRGAAGGAVTGALIGWIFGLFNWMSPVVTGFLLALYGLVIGAILGGLAGLLQYALTVNSRNFTSLAALTPSRYEVLVDTAWAEQAQRALREPATGTDRTPGAAPPGREGAS